MQPKRLRGTPKTLKEALANGLDDLDLKATDDELDLLARHVDDYIAQHFGTAMLEANANLLELFETITGRKPKRYRDAA